MTDFVKSIDPIDKRVGEMIKKKRLLAGLTQGDLGDELGLTFQQIQKYENGMNRVSASRLYRIAKVLKVSVSYFFSELDSTIKPDPAEAILRTSDGVKMARAYCSIKNPKVRRNVTILVSSLVEEA